jgi:hypothetical protein
VAILHNTDILDSQINTKKFQINIKEPSQNKEHRLNELLNAVESAN